MSIFEILKRVIARGGYDTADIQNKLDVFLLYGRITQAQYEELQGETT